MNNVSLVTGITNNGSFPVVGKNYFLTQDEIKNRVIDTYAYSYYERMLITIAEDGSQWVWREETSLDEVGGLLEDSYTYQPFTANGVDYGGRIFNFFPYQFPTAFERDINGSIKPKDSNNVITGIDSTISGGTDNIISGSFTSINGGKENEAVGDKSTVNGGYKNKAQKFGSVVSGGENNIANGEFSTILGGEGNEASTYGEVIGGTFATIVEGDDESFNNVDRLFTIGNGESINSRSDAFTILKSGLAILPSVDNNLINTINNPKSLVTKEYIDIIKDSADIEDLEEFTLKGTSLGKYNDGDTIPSHNSNNERWKDIGTKLILPTFDLPTLNLTAAVHPSSFNDSGSYETGTSVNITLTSTFTQKDGGAADNIFKIEDNLGNDITQPSGIYPLTFDAGNTKTFRASQGYGDGTGTKDDNLGNPVTNPITSGSVSSNTLTYRGFNSIWYGSVAGSETPSGQIRNLGNSILTNNPPYEDIKNISHPGNSFVIDTGTVNTRFEFFIPNGITLGLILDLDQNNANITGDYIKDTSSTSISDGGTGSIVGNVYRMTQTASNATSHRHLVNFSI